MLCLGWCGDVSPLNPPLGKEQRRMNDLVEIVVGEVAVLQLHGMKIRISCCWEFSAVYFWPENFELIFVCYQAPVNLSNWTILPIYTLVSEKH